MCSDSNVLELADIDPDALIADGLDTALIGWTDSWTGNGRAVRAVYSIKKVLEIFVEQGMDEEEAQEYFEFNVAGAYVGPHTPVFVYNFD